ncbi:hypothetical protein [Amycolatopsis sp. BJA-103]|uniref:hypothetical protein n=1 Tax=Amycolatopsis sp. BJA-103 TaxID=1911175 RepID=UPI001E399FEB|nr:hypothetical protein [Amycolatopsis sp. BJA-103]
MHADGLGIVTGFEAARRHGLRQIPESGSVHVLIPQRHQIKSAKFTIVERTIHFPRPWVLEGVPLAPPARAVIDGVRRLREADPVRALLIEAVESGLSTLRELQNELESGSKRGTALPRAVLREIDLGVKSVPEATALSLWKEAKLPPAEQNVKTYDSQGNYIAMPDNWCDRVGMAWEIDSWSFHFGKTGFAKTLHRNNRYAAAGIVVVQTLPSRLLDEPAKVVAELQAAFRAAASRPRPDVTVVRPARAA